MEMSGQLHIPAAIPPGKEPQYPLTGDRMGLKPIWAFCRKEKALACAGIWIPIANHYANWAVLGPIIVWWKVFNISEENVPVFWVDENGCSRFLANVGYRLPDYTVSWSRTQFKSLLTRKPRILSLVCLIIWYIYMYMCVTLCITVTSSFFPVAGRRNTWQYCDVHSELMQKSNGACWSDVLV